MKIMYLGRAAQVAEPRCLPLRLNTYGLYRHFAFEGQVYVDSHTVSVDLLQ